MAPAEARGQVHRNATSRRTRFSPNHKMPLPLHTIGPTAGSSHTHTIILLHGRDSQAREFASEFFECEATCTGPESADDDRTLPALFPTIRWVFPQAGALRSERF